MNKSLWAVIVLLIAIAAYGAWAIYSGEKPYGADNALEAVQEKQEPFTFQMTGSLRTFTTSTGAFWVILSEENKGAKLACNPKTPKIFPCSESGFQAGDKVTIEGWLRSGGEAVVGSIKRAQ